MSLESVAIALHHSKATGTAKLVMIGIANHDGDGGAWPSVATLARYANVDARSVQRALDRLETLHEIRRLPQAGGTDATPNHLRPNRYRVLLECPPTCDRTARHRDIRQPLIALSDELSTGVTDSSPGDTGVRGGVTPVSPEPSFNRTIDIRSLNSPDRARADETVEYCPAGHELIEGRCALACAADLERREALAGVSS